MMGWVQQSDGVLKRRPVLLLKVQPNFGDFIVCGLSTKLHREVRGLDMILRSSDPDFADSGLTRDSLIRITFLGVLTQDYIAGIPGEIAPERLRTLRERLVEFFAPDSDG